MPKHDRPDLSTILPNGSKRVTKRKHHDETSDDDVEEVPTPPPAKQTAATRKATGRGVKLNTNHPNTTSEPSPASSSTNPALSPDHQDPSPPPNPTGTSAGSSTDPIDVEDATAIDNLQHRLKMPGCPSASCVADHPRFRDNKSLAYTFLYMEKPVHSTDGTTLESCEMLCSWCNAKGGKHVWQWSEKNKGSTGNFMNHFRSKHTRVWEARVAEDTAVRDPNSIATNDGGSTQPMLHA
ncbi:hypothetical protein V5O48_015142 [Marasmius crinis-equi]|uniref:Uncharacterized protein n=1 Tax=Marasmius crinis-equi TaxID=585013 RepID=A0ABR3EVB4_9AGAR